METAKYLKYKGKPLVRKGNEIYYGNMTDKYVILFKILSSKNVGNIDVADKLNVQLMSTDMSLSAAKRLVEEKEIDGFYNAIEYASELLTKKLREK